MSTLPKSVEFRRGEAIATRLCAKAVVPGKPVSLTTSLPNPR